MDDAPSLISNYSAPAGSYDELMATDGSVRAPWVRFMSELQTLGIEQTNSRWKEAQQLLHENGVSYNAYGDSEGLQRPWVLSPLPIIIGPKDWASISRGLAQRARLLNALLADLYGPQRSINQGALPAEFVFSHPGYLTAIHGIAVPNGNWLPLYAADIIRDPSGNHCVVEDCTQTPSGAGYALENRIVISTVLPEVFRSCHVERLAHFFRALRECMRALAPHNRDNPRIALLTPGPYHSTYFEQAYLAQYLGLTLVSGDDLAVRNERLYIKTLGGLQPIDVVLRRVNDDFCDPLELRPESALGVPGLVQAVRMGNVALASPLGSGVLQSPALLAYLPSLCRQLLGEDLQLPSVPTYWCGDPQSLEVVLPRLSSMVIKSAFANNLMRPVHGQGLSESELNALSSAIRRRPGDYVVQEFVPPSTTPYVDGTGLVPGRCVLRCFAVCQKPEDYWMMPGALARVGSDTSDLYSLMQLGTRSKDVWIVSDEPVTSFSLLAPTDQPIELSRGGGDLASRVADNLYWLGRYAERAESLARLVRVLSRRLSDLANQQDMDQRTEFVALLAALEAHTSFLYVADILPQPPADIRLSEEQLKLSLCDAECKGSLISITGSILRTARVIRDRISLDTWRVLASLEEHVQALQKLSEQKSMTAAASILNGVILTLAGFSGLVMESMSRGHAWRFLDMGRRLERASTLILLLRSTLGRLSTREGPLLEAVLDIADSGMTYRRRYLANLQVTPVLDLLLTDATNPRSVIYQLIAIGAHIDALPPLPNTEVSSPQRRLLLSASNQIELADLSQLCKLDADGERPALEKLLQHLGTVLPALNDSLSNTYLNHAHVSRHLANDAPAALRPSRPGGLP